MPRADRARLADATRYLAPLVLDVDDPAAAAAAASLAGAVVVVGAPEVEPSLAAVVAESLAHGGPEPVVALNRTAPDGNGWGDVVSVELPEARMAAHFALAGREPRGEFGRAVAELADRCCR